MDNDGFIETPLGSLPQVWSLLRLLFAKHRLEERGTGSAIKSINKSVLQ
jgi:hypothetical protein